MFNFAYQMKRYVITAFYLNFYHILIEIGLVAFLLVYILHKSRSPRKHKPLTLKEKEELIKEWKPEALCEEDEHTTGVLTELPRLVLEGHPLNLVEIEGTEYLNFATPDFLGLCETQDVKDCAIEVVNEFAVGSCGPRGFYGTTPMHLSLENRIAEMYGTEGCVTYSNIIGCISSIIAAFSKKGDLLVIDEGCNYFIKHGARAARSNVFFFKHNDMDHLQRVLTDTADVEKRKGVTFKRKFIVVEGIYQDIGDLSPLPEIVSLKSQFNVHLILDDTLAVGALAPRGSLEFWGIKQSEAEIYCGSLNFAYASSCAFYVGDKVSCFYQFLGSSAFCFSASSPPYLSAAAEIMLDVDISEKLETLKRNCAFLWDGLFGFVDLEVSGSRMSPLVHLRLRREVGRDVKREEMIILKMAAELRRNGVLVEATRFEFDQVLASRPSLKIYVTALHTEEQLERLIGLVKDLRVNW